MKLYICASIMLLISSITLGATESISNSMSNRPRIGIEAGSTFSNVRGPSDINTSNYAGLAVGLNLDIPLDTYTSFVPEVVYMRRGVNLGSVGNAELKARYDSIHFPLLGKIHMDTPISPYIVFGPAFTFNVSNSLEATTPAGTTSISFNPKTFEVGAVLGAGVDVGAFFATVRYLWGFTDLDSNSPEWKSRSLDLLAGLHF